jgi:hypothetical protein
MFAEDLTIFFNTNEFAFEGTLDGVGVTGILDSGFEDPTLAGFGVVGSSPKVMLPATSVPTHPEGRALVIASGLGAGTYKVTQAYPDGTGITVLHLLSHIS